MIWVILARKKKTTLNTQTLLRLRLKKKLASLLMKLKEQKEKRQDLKIGHVLQNEINNLSQQLEIKVKIYFEKNEIQNEIFKLDKRSKILKLTYVV